ncbi:hypothetical protein GCM10010249_30020 [Streptomyces roseolilacinus]|uniref:Uncharacterized protein n=1 Tax=Streptomyces roseolilacinus TaxID=66904 RepID=A0A918B097_9ACTN|nr:hypothetical protein GCM10010249_30020 [Streptomyces roseolilacinus]
MRSRAAADPARSRLGAPPDGRLPCPIPIGHGTGCGYGLGSAQPGRLRSILLPVPTQGAMVYVCWA